MTLASPFVRRFCTSLPRLIIILALAWVDCGLAQAQESDITESDAPAAAAAQAKLITGIRQLTFEGKRAGKATSVPTAAGWFFNQSEKLTIPSFRSI